METLKQVGTFVMSPLSMLWSQVAAAIPGVLGGVLLLLLGVVLARLARAMGTKLLRRSGLDGFAEGIRLNHTLAGCGIQRSASELVAWLLSVFVFSAFLLASLDAMGLQSVSEAVRELVLYLPRLLGVMVVVMGGLWLARVASDAARRAAEGAGLDYAGALGKGTYGVVVFLAGLIAIRQLALDIGLIGEVVGIVLISLGLAASIAIGLGARSLAGELLAGAYVRELFKPGDDLELDGEMRGKVVEVGSVKTVVRLRDGRVLSLPNRTLVEKHTVVHPRQD